MPRPRFAAVLAVALACSLRSTVLLGQDEGAAPSIHAVGFDCAAPSRPPIAELVCGTPALTQADFALAQVYYALRQQVGQAAWPAIRQEYLHALDAIRQTCTVPRTGALPPAADRMIECVQREYGQRRSAWLSRLTGAAAEEARRSIGNHIELQSRLQKLGFLAATEAIDGVYGSATRDAIVAWQTANGLPATGILGDHDATLLTDAANGGGQPLSGSQIQQSETTPGSAATPSSIDTWYNYSNYGQCNPSKYPRSPGELISFDRANGVMDTVIIIDRNENGQPSAVRVGEPQGNGLESVYLFFRGKEACENYKSKQENKLNDLN